MNRSIKLIDKVNSLLIEVYRPGSFHRSKSKGYTTQTTPIEPKKSVYLSNIHGHKGGSNAEGTFKIHHSVDDAKAHAEKVAKSNNTVPHFLTASHEDNNGEHLVTSVHYKPKGREWTSLTGNSAVGKKINTENIIGS